MIHYRTKRYVLEKGNTRFYPIRCIAVSMTQLSLMPKSGAASVTRMVVIKGSDWLTY